MATIILHRTDLGESGIDITSFEFERCTDLIEREFDNAGIDHENLSFTADRWAFDIRESNRDPVSEIISKAIEGGFGQWTDDACIDAAVEFYKARRGLSGKTWWGKEFAGVADGVMSDVGFLVMQGRLDAAGGILNAATQALDEDMSDTDLIAIVEATFGISQREDGTWYNERFNALPTDAVIHAGRMLRRGDEEEAIGILVDNDEEDEEMSDDEAVAYAAEALGAEYDEDTDTYYLLRVGELVFRGISAAAMAEAGRGIRRDDNPGDWESTLRERTDFDD